MKVSLDHKFPLDYVLFLELELRDQSLLNPPEWKGCKGTVDPPRSLKEIVL